MFCKYFGSGVIIATAFIHLLAPAAEELGSPCLSSAFQNYDFAFAFSMIAVFMTFIVEMVAFRVGAKFAQKLAYDPHTGGHHHAAEHGGHAVNTRESTTPASDQEQNQPKLKDKFVGDDIENIGDLVKNGDKQGLSAAASEILGVGILEFGVIFRKWCDNCAVCKNRLPD